METLTINTTTVDAKEVKEVERTRYIFWVFPVKHWEIVSTKHIANDIHIITETPIRNIYFNGKNLN